MKAKVRVLLIDDHTIFRESLRRLLAGETGLEVVADCATIPEATEIIAETEVNLILLDYDLGEDAGLDLLRHLSQTGKPIRVLMLTGGMRPASILSALDLGVSGIVLKHSGTRQLLEAIDRVSRGEMWWDTAVVRSALAAARERGPAERMSRDLTPRQKAVLRGVLDGLANKEIAVRLGSSETAVKATLQELFNKGGVRTRSQLVRVALERFAGEWLDD
jgi:DNA-binding NarL/FixJ family response regulator